MCVPAQEKSSVALFAGICEDKLALRTMVPPAPLVSKHCAHAISPELGCKPSEEIAQNLLVSQSS